MAKRSASSVGFTLVELMIVVTIIGVLAAIALPNFLKFQARSKTGEAKLNLKSLYTGQKAYFTEKESYSTSLDGVGFQPARGNRYAYELSVSPSVHQTRSGSITGTETDFDAVDVDSFQNTALSGAPAAPASASVVSYAGEAGHTPLSTTPQVITGNRGAFAAEAVGNVDNETRGLDTWFIASQNATIAQGLCAPAQNVAQGNPGNVYDDIDCDTP